MRIVKYNKGKKADSSNITEQLNQIISQTNRLDGYFSFNNSVLVSTYDIASTGQVSSQYWIGEEYDCRVEYLECTGTQYIDTGIIGNLNTALEIKFNISTNQRYIAGCNYETSKAITLYASNSANQRFGDKTVTYAYSMNTDYIVNTSKSGLIINGNSLTRTTTNTFNTTGSLYLMNANTGNSSNGSVGKLYYAKIWEDGVLVRDLIPVRLGQVGYMYDKVSKQLFGNAGTGDFNIGSDV